METSDSPPSSYDSHFFRALEDGVQRSASAAAGLLIELFQPCSVVDVGCGTGIWLAALREKGIKDVLGIDGPWVPKEQLAIPGNLFWEYDLTAAFELDRSFDLALCLEVAEHLPPDAAPRLVENLARLAPVVVFSAAIPEQGGHGHVNEQWPCYWAELFASHGYRCFTGLRERLWHSDVIEVWYRQNMLCFAAPAYSPRLAALFGAEGRADRAPLDIVHPDLFVSVSHDLTRQTAYAERLESDLRSMENDLRSAQNNLRKCQDELFQIRNSRSYRLYQRLRPAWTAAKWVYTHVWPKNSDRT